MEKIREFFDLIGVGIVVRWYHFQEYGKVVCRYYRSPWFLKIDLLLLLAYLFRNPFTISRRFLQNRGEENVYAYGETPLTTMALIAEECGIQKQDTFFELGCGRGRSCFWMRQFRGCQVVGVDFVPIFIHIANWVVQKVGGNGVRFVCEDITQVDYSSATVVYLYGTGFDEETLNAMMKKFSTLPQGAKVISISYPLTDYCQPGVEMQVEKTFLAPFPWGSAGVYLHRKV